MNSLKTLFRRVSDAIPFRFTIGGLTGTRRFGDDLQTPILTFASKVGPHRVFLVGTMHFGDEAYFSRLRDFLDVREAEGAKVLYEKLRPSDPNRRRAMSRLQQELAAEIAAMPEESDRIAKSLGLQTINEGLPPRKDWVNADLTVDELARLLASGGTAPRARQPFDDAPVATQLARLGLRYLPYIVAAQTAWEALRASARFRTLVARRDRCAFNAIMAHVEDSDVVALWGGNHLPGISAHLRSCGYELTSVHWVTAVSLENGKPAAKAPPRAASPAAQRAVNAPN